MTAYRLTAEIEVEAQDKVEAEAILEEALATMGPITAHTIRYNLRFDPYPTKRQPATPGADSEGGA